MYLDPMALWAIGAASRLVRELKGGARSSELDKREQLVSYPRDKSAGPTG